MIFCVCLLKRGEYAIDDAKSTRSLYLVHNTLDCVICHTIFTARLYFALLTFVKKVKKKKYKNHEIDYTYTHIIRTHAARRCIILYILKYVSHCQKRQYHPGIQWLAMRPGGGRNELQRSRAHNAREVDKSTVSFVANIFLTTTTAGQKSRASNKCVKFGILFTTRKTGRISLYTRNRINRGPYRMLYHTRAMQQHVLCVITPRCFYSSDRVTLCRSSIT